MTKGSYAKVQRHGPLVAVADDIWQVEGTITPGMGMTITRNMTVLREGESLTIVNSVRLDDATEQELRKLGVVKHVVKLGHNHGIDDPYYIGRFSAQLWAQPGAQHVGGLATDRELHECGPLPFSAWSPKLFVFRNAKFPEAALFLTDAGILLTCDSVQNWQPGMPGCSWFAKLMMPKMGFPPGPLVGPFWRKYRTIPGKPLTEDFVRLCALPIRQVLVAHGAPIREDGASAIRQAVAAAFGPERFKVNE